MNYHVTSKNKALSPDMVVAELQKRKEQLTGDNAPSSMELFAQTCYELADAAGSDVVFSIKPSLSFAPEGARAVLVFCADIRPCSKVRG